MMAFQRIPEFLSGHAIEFGENSGEWDLRDDLLFVEILEQRGRRKVEGEEEER